MGKRSRLAIFWAETPRLALLWPLFALLPVPLAIGTIIGSMNVERSLRDLDNQVHMPAEASSPVVIERLQRSGGQPSAILADGLYVARLAISTPDQTVRRSLLDLTIAKIRTILPSRRYWGEAWAIRAFALASREGDTSPVVIHAFQRSYLDSPYLQDLAPWRIRYGLTYWTRLDERARQATANEAVWYSRRGPTEAEQVFTIARLSPGYQRFMLSWIKAREGDVGFQALTP